MLNIIESLKNLGRTGWMLRGILPSLVETIATHSFSAALIAQ